MKKIGRDFKSIVCHRTEWTNLHHPHLRSPSTALRTMPQAKWPHINGRFSLPTEIANSLRLIDAMLRHSSTSRVFWQKRPTVAVKAFFIIPYYMKLTLREIKVLEINTT